MTLVGLLVWILARSLYPTRLAGHGSQRFTLIAAFGAALDGIPSFHVTAFHTVAPVRPVAPGAPVSPVRPGAFTKVVEAK